MVKGEGSMMGWYMAPEVKVIVPGGGGEGWSTGLPLKATGIRIWLGLSG